jgi:hypothetical protein
MSKNWCKALYPSLLFEAYAMSPTGQLLHLFCTFFEVHLGKNDPGAVILVNLAAKWTLFFNNGDRALACNSIYL